LGVVESTGFIAGLAGVGFCSGIDDAGVVGGSFDFTGGMVEGLVLTTFDALDELTAVT